MTKLMKMDELLEKHYIYLLDRVNQDEDVKKEGQKLSIYMKDFMEKLSPELQTEFIDLETQWNDLHAMEREKMYVETVKDVLGVKDFRLS